MIIRRKIEQVNAVRQGANNLRISVKRDAVMIAQRFGVVNVTRAGGAHVVGEVPNGSINGSNATFTTDYSFVPGSVLVFRNGLAQYSPTHYVTSGTTMIILNFSPIVGDILTVNYIKA